VNNYHVVVYVAMRCRDWISWMRYSKKTNKYSLIHSLIELGLMMMSLTFAT